MSGEWIRVSGMHSSGMSSMLGTPWVEIFFSDHLGDGQNGSVKPAKHCAGSQPCRSCVHVSICLVIQTDILELRKMEDDSLDDLFAALRRTFREARRLVEVSHCPFILSLI